MTLFRKSCRLWDNVEKYGEARGDTDDVSMWRILVACWISKATCTHPHAHAHAPGHVRTRTHTQVCNIYLFNGYSDSLTRLNVMLCLHCLPCLVFTPAIPISSLLNSYSHKYKVVQIWPGRFVCKQVTVCPGHIWTTLYNNNNNYEQSPLRLITFPFTRILPSLSWPKHSVSLTRTPVTMSKTARHLAVSSWASWIQLYTFTVCFFNTIIIPNL